MILNKGCPECVVAVILELQLLTDQGQQDHREERGQRAVQSAGCWAALGGLLELSDLLHHSLILLGTDIERRS